MPKETEMFRVPIQEAVRWEIYKSSLDEALRDEALTGRFKEMEAAWEDAGGDFYDKHHLEVRVDGGDFVVILVDETDGLCPHDQNPTECRACQEFAARHGEPFWMRPHQEEPLSRFEVTLMVPDTSWVVEARDEQDAINQVAARADFCFLTETYCSEPYDLHVTELEEEDE